MWWMKAGQPACMTNKRQVRINHMVCGVPATCQVLLRLCNAACKPTFGCMHGQVQVHVPSKGLLQQVFGVDTKHEARCLICVRDGQVLVQLDNR
jgi:hypothetical protein